MAAHRFVRAAARSQLGPGQRLVVELDEHEILLVELGERVYAIGNVCTHEEVWLDDGILHEETCEIECPMHEGRFDVRTGAPTHLPCERPIPSYPVMIAGDDVLVGLP